MDKNRKRGERRDQKNTYRHREHDKNAKKPAFRIWHRCWELDGCYPGENCKGCAKLRVWRSGKLQLANDWYEYCLYGDS